MAHFTRIVRASWAIRHQASVAQVCTVTCLVFVSNKLGRWQTTTRFRGPTSSTHALSPIATWQPAPLCGPRSGGLLRSLTGSQFTIQKQLKSPPFRGAGQPDEGGASETCCAPSSACLSLQGSKLVIYCCPPFHPDSCLSALHTTPALYAVCKKPWCKWIFNKITVGFYSYLPGALLLLFLFFSPVIILILCHLLTHSLLTSLCIVDFFILICGFLFPTIWLVVGERTFWWKKYQSILEKSFKVESQSYGYYGNEGTPHLCLRTNVSIDRFPLTLYMRDNCQLGQLLSMSKQGGGHILPIFESFQCV